MRVRAAVPTVFLLASACGGSLPRQAAPAAASAPRAAPPAEPLAARVEPVGSAWMLRVTVACAAPPCAPISPGTPVYVRHYECAGARCTATSALDRSGVTDETGHVGATFVDWNGRPLTKVEVFVPRDRGGPEELTRWLRDNRRLVDDEDPGIVRVGEVLVPEAAARATSVALPAAALETEDTMWAATVAMCTTPVDETSCDGVREYQARYPQGKHAGEAFHVLFEATRALQRKFGEHIQQDWKNRREQWREQRELQQRMRDHERRARECMAACYADPRGKDKQTCEARCR